MPEISASAVKTLREKTGAGMLDCRNALVESNGDMEAAEEYLRKKGLANASKKAGRTAADGVIAVCITEKKGCLIELNAETDFVARNEQFQAMARKIAKAAIGFSGDAEALRGTQPTDFTKTVQEEITELIAKIGENMELRRIASLEVKEGLVAHYIHSAIADQMGKIGVLVALESKAPAEQLKQLGKQLAMHIAATSPEALDTSDLSPQRVEKEREILREQSMTSGKPADVVEKMLEGRLRKFFEDVVLMEQNFIMAEDKQKVRVVIEEAAKAAGTPIKLTGYIRFALGEGIEKKDTDFAQEVASMVK